MKANVKNELIWHSGSGIIYYDQKWIFISNKWYFCQLWNEEVALSGKLRINAKTRKDIYVLNILYQKGYAFN